MAETHRKTAPEAGQVDGVAGRPLSRPAPRPTRAAATSALLEIAFIAVGLVVYFGVRLLVRDEGAQAVANAHAIARFEDTLHLAWEVPMQEAFLGHVALIRLFNWVYIWGHWPVLVAIFFYLYARHRPAYRRLRTSMIVSGLIGLLIFLSFPVAPPRLAGEGVVDTIARYDPTYQEVGGRSRFTNQHAAMPSFHFGWNLLGALCLASTMRRRAPRLLVVALPFVMALAITATGNHYVVDAVAGGALALLGLAVARAAAAAFGEERRPAADAGAILDSAR